MSMDTDRGVLQIPRIKPLNNPIPRIALVVTVVAAFCWAFYRGYFTRPLRSNSPADIETVVVDRGDIDLVVIEKGSLESSDSDVVRCRVESFQALPVGAPPANAESRSSAPRVARSARPTVAPPTAKVGPSSATMTVAGKSKSPAKSPGGLGASTMANNAFGSRAASNPTSGTPKPGSSAATSSALVATQDDSSASKRPVIRSFDQVVAPHVSLREALPDQGSLATIAPPAPTILSILAEGQKVKAGDIVCELDSSAFREALQVQQIRCVQAKAWVDQAKFILEADRIALREYEDGVYPQDLAQVKRYIDICEIECDRAARNLTWARSVHAKGFRTEAQVEADAAAMQQSEIARHDAEQMRDRLVHYTGKRIRKALRARLEAIRADLLAFESCSRLETERRRRIETMIANCTMRASRDGVVVHANRSRGSGRVESQIREGMTVYPSQPIFRLLDARRLHVKARINESQIKSVRTGQPVMIHLEAFPDRVLRGSVAEIIPIPSLADGPFSDVHSFCANVRIESGGSDDLRPGLTAELEFLIAARHEVTRVPLEAIRWVDDRSYAAVTNATPDGPDWQWRPISLGATDTEFAEVKSGLKPGERVIAQCESLPEIDPDQPNPEPIMDLAMDRPKDH
jgi:multidrug efflux pump subunit AcrA (membrane-fusion protein)